jgi:two-component system LytT family response regulator
MIKALIIDDELKARNILDYYLKNFVPEITDIRQAASVDEALCIVKEYEPHIVFWMWRCRIKVGLIF